MKRYEECLQDVIRVCADKWSDPKKCFLCEDYDASNWMTAMYMDYENNYISRGTFIQTEILPNLEWDCFRVKVHFERAANSLLDLFQSIGNTSGVHQTYDEVGEFVLKIINGEI